jgi:hypothetical protein
MLNCVIKIIQTILFNVDRITWNDLSVSLCRLIINFNTVRVILVGYMLIVYLKMSLTVCPWTVLCKLWQDKIITHSLILTVACNTVGFIVLQREDIRFYLNLRVYTFLKHKVKLLQVALKDQRLSKIGPVRHINIEDTCNLSAVKQCCAISF